MDQVKEALAVLKKQHFWVLSVLVVIMAVVVWKIAAGHVGDQFDDRKSKLEGTLSTVEGIKNDSTHPNEKTIDAIKKLTGNLTGEVFLTWRDLYAQQSEKNPWPEELGVNFVRMINELPEDQEIARFKDRDTYYYFIKNHFHVLDEIVDSIRVKEPEGDPNGAETAPASAMMSPMGMMGSSRKATAIETTGKVDWNASDRQRVQGGFVWDSPPNTVQIRLAQEDLWVYEALLRVVAETNIGATGYFNAAVKRIEALEIGQAAARGMSSTKLFGSGGGGGYGDEGSMGSDDMGSMGGGSMMDDDSGMGGPAGGFGVIGSADDGIKSRLMNNRYVDQFGEPLSADLAENSPPFAEFKMMPIRMRLLVSQNKIADFLVDCANCTMPIDVRRVSLWPSNQATGGGASGGGMGDMGDIGMDESYGGMGGGMDGGMGGGMGGGNATGASVVTEVSQKDIPIEVQGIIYIFNRPERGKVGTGTAAEQEGSPDSGAPTAPPATPAAAAPEPTPPAAPPAGTIPPATPPGAAAPPAIPPAPPAPVAPAAVPPPTP